MLTMLLLLRLPETGDGIVPPAFLASICLLMMPACGGVDY